MVQKVLLLIAWAADHDELEISELCEAISLTDTSTALDSEDIIDVEEVTLRCSSLIRTSNDGRYLEFAHFTVREYLESETLKSSPLSSYHVSEDLARDLLAELGLRTLLLPEFSDLFKRNKAELKVLRRRNKQHPFYSYISRVLPLTLDPRQLNNPKLFSLATQLFDLDKSANFVAWATNVAGYMLRPKTWFSRRTTITNRRPIVPQINTQSISSDSDTDSDSSTASPGALESELVTLFFAILRADFTPLHLAAALGLTRVCEYLLANGADANLKSRIGTPLHCVVAGTSLLDSESRPSRRTLREYFRIDSCRPIIDLLVARGAKGMDLVRTPLWKAHFSTIAFDQSSEFEDWTLFGHLLMIGMPIDSTTIKKFDGLCDEWFQKPYATAEEANSMVENVLKSTRDRKATDSAAAQIYALAWSFGVKHRVPCILANNDNLRPSGPEVTDESLFLAITVAIENDNAQFLRQALLDTNLKTFQDWDSDKRTPVHLAATHCAVKCMEIMLEHGFDAHIKDINGMYPIQLCAKDGGEDVLEVLIRHKVPTSVSFEDGSNLWHIAASRNATQILQMLLEDESHAREALRATNNAGQTPLLVALQLGRADAALLLLKHCKEEACFQEPDSLFQNAVRILDTGSEDIVQKLVDNGIKPTHKDPTDPTPLHYVTHRTPLGCLKLLKSLYPGFSTGLLSGKTAIEVYLETQLTFEGDHKDKIGELLDGIDELSRRSQHAKLWAFVCSPKILDHLRPGTDAIIRDDTYDVIDLLLERGVMADFEDETKISGMKPMAEAVSSLFRAQARNPRPRPARPGRLPSLPPPPLPRTTAFPIARRSGGRLPLPPPPPRYSGLAPRPMSPLLRPPPPPLPPQPNHAASSKPSEIYGMILKIVRRARYLDTVRDNIAVVYILKLAIFNYSLDLALALLEHGVNVHYVGDGMSVLDNACAPNTLCPVSLFKKTLEHVDKTKLDNFNPGANLALIHYLGQAGVKDAVQKLELLVAAGANPNLRTIDGNSHSAMTYHILQQGSIAPTALKLLDLGGDPTVKSSTDFDAANAAALCGNVAFLKHLRAREKVNPTQPISWQNKCIIFKGDAEKQYVNSTSLHLAASTGRVPCLEFLVDEGLITNVNAEAERLWTPLHMAAKNGHVEAIEFLLSRGANVNAETSTKALPLHLAVEHRHMRAVQVLAEAGSAQTPDARGMRPLDYAKQMMYGEIVPLLMASQTKDHTPRFVLMRLVVDSGAKYLENAIASNDLTLCEQLHRQGCSLDARIPSCHDCTPLLHALRLERYRIARWLLDCGVSTRPVYCDRHQPKWWFAPVNVADAACSWPSATPMVSEVLTKYLEEGGGWMYSTHTPLHSAVLNKNKAGVDKFLLHVKENQAAHWYST
jgi:ankyrin repeat protein